MKDTSKRKVKKKKSGQSLKMRCLINFLDIFMAIIFFFFALFNLAVRKFRTLGSFLEKLRFPSQNHNKIE